MWKVCDCKDLSHALSISVSVSDCGEFKPLWRLALIFPRSLASFPFPSFAFLWALQPLSRQHMHARGNKRTLLGQACGDTWKLHPCVIVAHLIPKSWALIRCHKSLEAGCGLNYQKVIHHLHPCTKVLAAVNQTWSNHAHTVLIKHVKRCWALKDTLDIFGNAPSHSLAET